MANIKPLIHPILIYIIERFPEHNDVVHDLFRINQSFNEICRDYKQCYKILLYWETKQTEEARQRKAEYKEILLGLEQEIMQYVKSI